MDKRTIILIVTILTFIVIGMFTFAFLKQKEINKELRPTDGNSTTEELAYPEITRIDAKHYFIDGEHTFAGEILMPTPCDLLTTDAVVMESYPEQIRLEFSVINNSEMCAQVVTSQRFLIPATASTEAVVTATFMGREVELNLTPAAEGEVPADFELFIKG
ncbi:MAG TPA: hypothetical protein PKD95_04250 [Candidatus Paceibacterota bacterium]|nr:hypothetical protein [Candidatus Paceibacterota bacterium]